MSSNPGVPPTAWGPLVAGIALIVASSYLVDAALPAAIKGYGGLACMALGWPLAAIGAYRVLQCARTKV